MSAREEADLQVRRRLRDLIAIAHFPRFMRSAQSAPKLCFHTAEAGRAIAPPRIVADDLFATDTASLGRWDCDVLGVKGAARLKVIVYQIHQVCA